MARTPVLLKYQSPRQKRARLGQLPR
eukprot:s8699_g1.t1